MAMAGSEKPCDAATASPLRMPNCRCAVLTAVKLPWQQTVR